MPAVTYEEYKRRQRQSGGQGPQSPSLTERFIEVAARPARAFVAAALEMCNPPQRFVQLRQWQQDMNSSNLHRRATAVTEVWRDSPEDVFRYLLK